MVYNRTTMREFESSPLTVSITGIDGSGKSTVSQGVSHELGRDFRLAKVSRPTYSVVEGEKQFHFQEMIRKIDQLHAIADRAKNKPLSVTANAVNVILQGRVIEPTVIDRVRPDLVLGTRDLLIDPSVYAIFYSPILGKRDMDTRISFFQKLTGAEVRDVIFFLTVPPDEAVSRINKRIADESRGATTDRSKWRHMHEHADYLDQLQNEYYDALDVVELRGTPNIYEIDTSYLPQAEVEDFITQTLRNELSNK